MDRRVPVAMLVLLSILAAPFAGAQGDASPTPPEAFAGAWRIVAGAPAGIDDDPPADADPRLLGATVRFDDARIEAPHPLGCANARYAEHAASFEGLFQGTLDNDDGAARAAALGLSPTAAPTLAVSCDTGVFDYHAASATRLLTMLDRVIYTLERTD